MCGWWPEREVAGTGCRHNLPTKAGQLDWSFGEAMQGLGQKTGARYGLSHGIISTIRK